MPSSDTRRRLLPAVLIGAVMLGACAPNASSSAAPAPSAAVTSPPPGTRITPAPSASPGSRTPTSPTAAEIERLLAAIAANPNDADSRRVAAVAIAPQPEAVAMLGDLLVATGDAAGAKRSFKTVRFIEQLGSVQGTVYDRQLLRFELDHDGGTADLLAAAQASLAARPDSTGHDLVAWALYRLGRYDEAAAEILAARAYGADDARLRFHDGAIALARGDRTAGRSLLESALASGPALDPLERAEAGRLART